jgi:hypothetical protein
MPASKIEINRPLTGILAVVLLGAGLFLMIAKHQNGQFTAALVRTGLLLGALWLALPTKTRPAAWEDVSWTSFLIVVIAIGVFLTSRLRWWSLPILIAVGIGIYFTRKVFAKRR